jgi:uncharacterized protein (TIGR02266 family)
MEAPRLPAPPPLPAQIVDEAEVIEIESATAKTPVVPVAPIMPPALPVAASAPIDAPISTSPKAMTSTLEVPPAPATPAPIIVPAPPSSARAGARAEARHAVELAVDFASDSNFYVGFAENISAGGVFVATYILRPIGSIIDLRIRIAGEEDVVELRGEVRWVREPSSSSDVWPGMGIRFEALSPADEARVRAFLATREPLFYPE